MAQGDAEDDEIDACSAALEAAGWKAREYKDASEDIWDVFAVKGTAFHFASRPSRLDAWRAVCRDALGPPAPGPDG